MIIFMMEMNSLQFCQKVKRMVLCCEFSKIRMLKPKASNATVFGDRSN